MNIDTLIRQDIRVVVDDYDTGEVVFEGEFADFSTALQANFFEAKALVEWESRGGKQVALVTLKLGENLEAFKRVVSAAAPYDKMDGGYGSRRRSEIVAELHHALSEFRLAMAPC